MLTSETTSARRFDKKASRPSTLIFFFFSLLSIVLKYLNTFTKIELFYSALFWYQIFTLHCTFWILSLVYKASAQKNIIKPAKYLFSLKHNYASKIRFDPRVRINVTHSLSHCPHIAWELKATTTNPLHPILSVALSVHVPSNPRSLATRTILATHQCCNHCLFPGKNFFFFQFIF